MEKFPNTHIKPTSELPYETFLVPTVKTWNEFKDENFYASLSGGYLDATYDMLQKIEQIIHIQDFYHMREEITKLYTERYEFLSHALDQP